MKNRFFLAALAAASCLGSQAQNLDKMQWFNEPESYTINGGTLEMDVPAQTDFWRIAHYGFTVDDGPFLYGTYGGEFEAKIKVSGDYKERFDQAGLMIRIDHENYVKCGIEYVDGKYNVNKVSGYIYNCWQINDDATRTAIKPHTPTLPKYK